MYRSLTRLALMLGAACLSLTQPVWAQDESPPLRHLLQHQQRVVVGADGSGASAARFPTTVGGEDVHYVMLVETGCPADDPASTGNTEPCPPPVNSLQITLNDDVVFQTTDMFRIERVRVALNPVGGELNSVVMTAGGVEGAAARLAIFALQPPAIAFGGRSILPWAWLTPKNRNILTIHNAGPANIAVRLAFFNPDGTLAGRSGPRILPNFATVNLDLEAVVTNLGLNWRAGAVHVYWGSRGWSRVSTVGIEVHREPDDANNLEVTYARNLPLDDYGPFPLNHDEINDLFGQQ